MLSSTTEIEIVDSTQVLDATCMGKSISLTVLWFSVDFKLLTVENSYSFLSDAFKVNNSHFKMQIQLFTLESNIEINENEIIVNDSKQFPTICKHSKFNYDFLAHFHISHDMYHRTVWWVVSNDNSSKQITQMLIISNCSIISFD